MGKKSNKKKRKKKKKLSIRKIFLGILIFIIIIMLLPSIILQVWPDGFDNQNSNNINCRISFTSLVTTKYEGIIEVTLTNKSKNHIPDVKAFLNFSAELPIVISSKEGSSVADFGNLRAEETKSKKIKFYLNSSITEPITFDLKVFCGNSEEINKPNYKIGFLGFFGKIIKLSIWILGTILATLGSIVGNITVEKITKK